MGDPKRLMLGSAMEGRRTTIVATSTLSDEEAVQYRKARFLGIEVVEVLIVELKWRGVVRSLAWSHVGESHACHEPSTPRYLRER